jgi:hypothetical protein
VLRRAKIVARFGQINSPGHTCSQPPRCVLGMGPLCLTLPVLGTIRTRDHDGDAALSSYG